MARGGSRSGIPPSQRLAQLTWSSGTLRSTSPLQSMAAKKRLKFVLMRSIRSVRGVSHWLRISVTSPLSCCSSRSCLSRAACILSISFSLCWYCWITCQRRRKNQQVEWRVKCWSLSYSAILCSRRRLTVLLSPAVLHQWLAFQSAFLNVHRSGVLTVLARLVPYETAAVLACFVYTIQPSAVSLHAKPHV